MKALEKSKDIILILLSQLLRVGIRPVEPVYDSIV